MQSIQKLLVYIIILITTLTISGCYTMNNKNNTNKRPILIQGAMDVETDYMTSQLNHSKVIKIGGWTFTKGLYDNYPVIISRTNIGMVNTGAVTALAIEKFNPIAIINQGTAGGHSNNLKPYDIVIGSKSINFGAIKTKPSLKGKGVNIDRQIPMKTIYGATDNKEHEVEYFNADSRLLQIAKSTITEYTKGKVEVGTIGSADQWNREIDKILWLNKKLNTSSEDMETASAAQISAVYNIPFLGIRIISNSELNDSTYHRNSGIDCQKFVLKVVKNYINQIR